VSEQEPQRVSLNQIWAQYEEAEADEVELMTTVTLTLPDGRSATGTLVIAHYEMDEEDEDADEGDISVELQLDTDQDEDFSLVEIAPMWEGGWTKERLIRAFNIDPYSAIWEMAPDGPA
jgi:hypothetical protein